MSTEPSAGETASLQNASSPAQIARGHRRLPDETPKQIGPYKLLEQIGEGGMGVVYLAEQTKPIHRRVALKIIKLGMDTKQVIARFETEREALALMNHANVAKVLDAGTTETGRPYFVMEYVPGISITEYCDGHRLTTEERLRLFVDVCHAVQHAHQKGIIHRDIKPSNVLVTVQDDRPAPKVIDFGVAKATQHRLTQRTLFTEQGQLIGTPGYMSPEQAGMTAFDIDTRTDIYSLGVLLYELLVGAMPFDTKSLLQAGLAEIQRIICEINPPKPSTRLSSLANEPRATTRPRRERCPRAEFGQPESARIDVRGSSIDDIAHCRHTEAKALIRQIRGDLDWIVMKAIEKDRSRRYDTANALALEIVRHLHHEPVLAGPPSAAYRLSKFVRRNRATVVASSAVILSLAAGLVGTSVMYVQAVRQRDRAQEAERLTQESLSEAEEARNEAEQVTKFLTDTLAAADPSKQGKDVTVREVLDRASDKISQQFAGRPLIEARLQQTVGSTYDKLGLYERAEAHLASAAATYRRVLGERNPRTLVATSSLSVTIGNLGKYPASEAAHRSTLEIQRRVLGADHPDTLASMSDLANALREQGRYEEAEELHRTTLETRCRSLREGHPDTLASMNNLANVLMHQARYVETEELYRKTLDVRRRLLGEEHPDTLASMNNLGNVLLCQARWSEAEELYRNTLDIKRRVLGEQHPDTLASMNNLGSALYYEARYPEAEELHRKTLEVMRRVLGMEHPATLASMGNLANVLIDLDRCSESEEFASQALTAWEKRGDRAHVWRWVTISVLGGALTGLGRFAEAEPHLLAAYDALKDRADLSPTEKRRALDRVIRLYDSRRAAEPDMGYAEKAAKWRATLEQLNAETQKPRNAEAGEATTPDGEGDPVGSTNGGNGETPKSRDAEMPEP